MKTIEFIRKNGRLELLTTGCRMIKDDNKDGHYWYSRVIGMNFTTLVTLAFDGNTERCMPSNGIITHIREEYNA